MLYELKMFSDDCYHTEDEFYNPEELNIEENEPILASTSYVNNDKCGEIVNDIQDFILSKRPESTLKKTKYDMNIWKKYFDSENELRDIEIIPADELNVHICRFSCKQKRKMVRLTNQTL